MYDEVFSLTKQILKFGKRTSKDLIELKNCKKSVLQKIVTTFFAEIFHDSLMFGQLELRIFLFTIGGVPAK